MGKVPNGVGAVSPGFVQQATLEKLKCSNCKKHLSVLPIHRNPSGDPICGRCPVDASNNSGFIRDELFENAIEFQKFPCSNRECGCLEILFPIQLARHEETCSYKKLDCPTKVYNNCIWQGTLSEILEHCEKKHPTFILKDRFEIDFVNNHSENYVMPYGEDLYVVTRESNSYQGTFWVTVTALGSNVPTGDYIYHLNLESGNKAYKHSLEQTIGNRVELQGKDINNVLHDPITIVGNITIQEQPKKVINKEVIIVDDDEDDSLDNEQLKEVECPVCMEHMVPPIYQCEIGHSICKACKESQDVCPTCKATFKKTQNFVLERIILNMIYPCKHQGCKFKTKAKFIRQHEASCLFGPFKCPLKDYEDCLEIFQVSELFNHIRKRHYENLLEFDTVNLPFDNSIDEDIHEGYILKHGELLFKICFMYSFEQRKFFWSIQLVGPAEESSKYNYELEIIDNSGKNRRLYIKTNCTQLADKDETFRNADNYNYLDYDQISKFIKHQLSYRILINPL